MNSIKDLFTETTPAETLKLDLVGKWIEREWMPRQPEQTLITVRCSNACVDYRVLEKFRRTRRLKGYTFAGYEPLKYPPVPRITELTYKGEREQQSGAYLYRFNAVDSEKTVEVLVIAAYFSDEYTIDLVTLGSIPEDFLPACHRFTRECERISYGLDPERVRIIGGRSRSFSPTVDWEDIVLPPTPKTQLLEDF